MTPVPSPGAHGGDGARLAAALGVDPAAVLDLSASLNPLAPDAGEVVAKHVDAVGRYPDPQPATAALAAALGVEPEQVLLTNGGSEAIALVAAEVGGSVVEPDFSLYPRGDGPPRWRSNPHNPSGRLARPDAAGADTLRGSNADTLRGSNAESLRGSNAETVWDEAFYPLATGRWTSGAGLVVGSLTKVFACPGLRLGYVVAANGSLLARLRARQPEWSVSSLAAAAVPHLLERADLAAWAVGIAGLRSELVGVLRSSGLDPEPSDANWVLVRAPGLRAALAPFGVLVRDCAGFGLPDHVRIAVPGADGLARLSTVLSRCVERS
ncbi:MAG: aminotransferase class I/II-fold pyridoxal phosphate-dependent enzyme [Actinomycetota bacterium]|nr:aminotransferase class I/II-fold pyridoxal phosphate-dependent enzyme [Actinomycetota bacterium]